MIDFGPLGRISRDGTLEVIEILLGVLTGVALLVAFGVALGAL